MIDLYFRPSPNTWKISIMLEECGLAYRIKPVDTSRGEQFAPEFLKISPNNRIPAIVDNEAPDRPVALFESGAILVYLADKTGRFLATSGDARYEALQWLFWQVGGLGPMAGQAHHFRLAREQISYGVARYTGEVARLYGVMDQRLADRDYLAIEYGIADIACIGWINLHGLQGQKLDDFPNLARWFSRVRSRDAVLTGLRVGSDLVPEETRKVLSIDDR